MTMYLGMSDEDYNNVIENVPIHVADRLGIQDTTKLTTEALKEQIRQFDATALTLMEEFLKVYKTWWQKSKEVGENELPNSDDKDQMIALIDRRDEIRRALLSYLNYAKTKISVGT